MWVTRKERTIVAVLGGNTIAGLALSLLLKGVGYETIILKAPPDVSKDLLRDVNVLLVAPGLGDRRREESLTALGGVEGRLRIPVPAFTLAVEEELFRSLVEGMRDHAIFMLDPATRRIIQANTSLQDSLGYEAGELERLTLYDIVAYDRDEIDHNIGRVLEEGRLSIGERQYRCKDGSLIDVEVNASAISYDGRRALCVVVYDVTRRKRVEGALIRSLNIQLALFETGQILGSSLQWEEIGSRLLAVVRRVSNLTAVVISVPDENGNYRSGAPQDWRGCCARPAWPPRRSPPASRCWRPGNGGCSGCGSRKSGAW
jgi:PAS domain S-box-containing protein